MLVANRLKTSRFWMCYFFIRLFYLLFAVLIYARLTTLGDTEGYLTLTVPFSLRIFYDSTYFMFFIGGLIGIFFRQNMLLANLPSMFISFFIIKWAIEKLALRKHVNNTLLMIVISLPNFVIWTTIWSKELFGLIYTAIIAVLVVNFLNRNYKIGIIDIFGFYLCLLFNPQYLPFILQGLIFIYIAHNLFNHKPTGQIMLGVVFLFINVLFLYLIRDIVNMYAMGMHAHFELGQAGATRDNIFLEDYDFFRYLPWGMFVGFFGPTISEMRENPLHLIAGVESLLKIILFIYLSKYVIIDCFLKWKSLTIIPISYFFIFMGILFIHYPFSIFNPGSAIRYRSRFIFLFIILLLYLYTKGKDYYLQRRRGYYKK